MKSIQQITKSYVEWAPLSLTIREVSRIQTLRLLDQKENIFKNDRILDVGCGDGKWWSHIIPDELSKVHGIDISTSEISIANTFISAQCLDITSPEFMNQLKFKKFNLIIGNCSLEHVFEIDKALKNINEALETGGTFILLIPTPYWALKGNSIGFLNSLSPRLSMSISGLMNGFFQHWHLYSYKVWTAILTNTGFTVNKAYGLGNKRSEFLFRLGLPTAFISFLVKCVTGKYLNYFLRPLTPSFIKFKLAQKICESLDSELLSPDTEDIFEYMIVCKK
jgi:SAM-dependent methyltransferase